MGPFSDKEIQFFKDCWNPIKDTEIFIKHHLFVYKRYMLDQSLEGVVQKNDAAMPFTSSKLKWA